MLTAEPAAHSSVRPIILSGGAGTRLWPVSRLAFPKQLLPIAADQSMLQVTASRASGPGFSAPVIVGDEEHRFFIKEQLERTKLAPAAVILEPVARNTAPAIGLAASWVHANLGDDLLLVLPSDHVIRDEAKFRAAIAQAIPTAMAGGLVTFGIVPDSVQTGYGYIELGDESPTAPGVHRVARFVEKPSLEVARDYVESKRYLWNSGMFLFRASVILDELGPPRSASRQRGHGCEQRIYPRRPVCPSGQGGVRVIAQHLDRFRGDGSDRQRLCPAGRHRLVRRRLMVVAMGYFRQGRARQCRPGPGPVARKQGLPDPVGS